MTAAGRDLREAVERRTDEAERDVIARLGDTADELFALLRPISRALVGKDGYPSAPDKMFA